MGVEVGRGRGYLAFKSTDKREKQTSLCNLADETMLGGSNHHSRITIILLQMQHIISLKYCRLPGISILLSEHWRCACTVPMV